MKPDIEHNQTSTRAPSVWHLKDALLIVLSVLLCLGALMVFSAGASLDQELDVKHFWRYATLRRVMFVPIVWLALALGQWIPYRWLLGTGRRWYASPIIWILILTIIMLILVLIPGIGTEVNQSRRWLKVGPPNYGLTFQPSELAKWVTVLFLAAYCAARGDRIRQFRHGFLPAVAVLLMIVALIGKEDFGTAALVAGAGTMMLLLGGARWWHVSLLIPLAVLGVIILVMMNPYRMERIKAHFSPTDQSTAATAYQARQSIMAISAGGMTGVGLGQGTIKLGWLPEDTTDFIFAIVGEELGFVGCAFVVALYLIFIICGFMVMCQSPDTLGRFIAIGITGTLTAQAAMNLLVVTGLAPTKGIALPFISAGGSGLVVTALAVSVLVNVARKSSAPQEQFSQPA